MAETLINMEKYEEAQPFLDVAKDSGIDAQKIDELALKIKNKDSNASNGDKNTIVLNNTAPEAKQSSNSTKEDPQDLFKSETIPQNTKEAVPAKESSSNNEEVQKFKEEIENLKAQLKNKNSELETKQSELEQANQSLEEIATDLKSINGQNSDIKSDLVKFGEELASKTAEIGVLSNQNKALQTQIDENAENQSSVNAEVQKKQAIIGVLKKQIVEMKKAEMKKVKEAANVESEVKDRKKEDITENVPTSTQENDKNKMAAKAPKYDFMLLGIVFLIAFIIGKLL